MKKLYLILLSFTLFVGISTAQTGDELFKKKEYIKAMVNYEREVKTSPSKYLPLAKCYFAQRDFDKAIEALKNYLEKNKTADTAVANTWLRLLQREDDETRLINMGAKINSGKGEYYPHVSNDGKRLYYIGYGYTKGKGGEDIYVSYKQADGTWGEPENMADWNTTSHESVMSTSSDGNTAIMFGNYQGTFGGGDLFYSVKTASGWSAPCNLGGTINGKTWEAQAALGPDGRTLVFCSDRDDKDNADIYVSFLTENGWSKPLNLGTSVNKSGYRENGPILSADNKTLYFSSDRKGGFGGFDLYMSRRLDDTWTNWSEPVNLGRFINTLADDRYMTIPSSGNKAYTTINDAPDGYGDYDLYEFILPLSMRPEQTFTIRGKVTNEVDSAAGVVIKYMDMETMKEVARISSSSLDGNYYVSLPARRKYQVVIDMKGYLFFQDILDLTRPELYQAKATIGDKMSKEMDRVNELKKKLDQYNIRLQQLIESKSTEIGTEFKKYQLLVDDYKAAIAQLDQSVYKAKSDWLSEENNLELTINYKVTRIKIGAKFELKNIFFDFGKATLKDESKTELDKLVDIMNRSDIIIELGGHTDNVGSDEANLKLSQERVGSVKSYLVSKGISENRIAAVGYGETQPIASNDNEVDRAKNRRVEVKITEIKPREGSGDYTQIEQDKEKDKKIDLSKIDMLTALQKAARIGGIPEGSACSDKVTYIDRDYKPGKKENYGGDDDFDPSNFSWDFSKNKIEMEEFHYKRVAISLQNYGYRGIGNAFGAGLVFINKKRTETSFAFYTRAGSDSLKAGNNGSIPWSFSFGQLATAKATKRLCVSLGYEFFLYNSQARRPKNTGQGIEDGLKSNIYIPIGFRYLVKLTKGVVVNPEVLYYTALYSSKSMKDAGYGKAGYLHIGANARLKILQGGVFYNYGPFIRYFGLRAGVTF